MLPICFTQPVETTLDDDVLDTAFELWWKRCPFERQHTSGEALKQICRAVFAVGFHSEMVRKEAEPCLN